MTKKPRLALFAMAILGGGLLFAVSVYPRANGRFSWEKLFDAQNDLLVPERRILEAA